MKAMIFAAGLGTRLKPLTDTMPKALVPVAGKPLLQHVMDRLGAAGIDDTTVNVHHFAEQIIDYLSARYTLSDRPGPGVHISDERDILRETGGGIAHARPFLDGNEPFLVHNVDILSNLDIRALFAAHRSDSLATLVVSERESSRYLLFDGDMRLVGWTNVKTGEVRTPFGNLDLQSCRKLAFSGIHLMSPSVFPLMEGKGERFPIIDFYLSVAASQRVAGYIPSSLELLDVGKLGSLPEAEALVSRLNI